MSTLSKGNLFPETLVKDLISKAKGKSSLAILSQSEPIKFNGQTEMIFSMDNEVDIVAENGAKSHGGISIAPVKVIPIKIEYGARISDEFDMAAEEEQIDYLKAFNEGFAKKVARAIDLMSMHGINPRTGQASSVIGTNHFDSKVSQKVTMSEGVSVDENIEAAIALVQANENDVTGMAMSPALKSELAKLKTQNGSKLYPELAWGSNAGSINGLPVDSNSTVSANGNKDRAIVGDFQGSFKWGFAKEIPMDIIRYGNPDNDVDAGDLKGHNQIYIRAEAYLGWAILDPNAFARIVEA